ncbi:hypothetical protein [Gordonia rubripertincta]|uniref:hypothetical protein n=1 Tax=Gordonia rubripertincta TaxID=36822 RepID=UPI00141C33EB|nr:hypothetical protein [Gordonia rubripertincta]
MVVDYRQADFTDALSDYDLAIDALGGDNPLRTLTVLKPGGLALGVAGRRTPVSSPNSVHRHRSSSS